MTKILNSFFFSKKKLLLAFEFGVVLSEVMYKHKKEVTREIMERAEDIILAELSNKTPAQFANEMIPNIMASVEPK